MKLLEIKELEKHYTGNEGLNGINMQIPCGEIVGLLGPNGSGKTTLMKTIAGLLSPDKGEIIYPGNAKRGIESKKTISFLPDFMAFPSWMRIKDAFAYQQAMYPDYSEEKAAEMTELLELSMDSPIKKLSKGMQERVSLGLAFSRKTSLYLLDEPLGGIDPVGKMKVLSSILSMDLADTSIILSTHLVKEVETIFDSFYFISNGTIIQNGNCEELREQSGKTVEQLYLEVFSNVKTV
jgi:ABC-2 type transport system ATP-binding protein